MIILRPHEQVLKLAFYSLHYKCTFSLNVFKVILQVNELMINQVFSRY